MNKIFTLWILILVLFSGCAKQTFYFFKTVATSNYYHKKIADGKVQDSTQSAQTYMELTKADTLSSTVTAGLEHINKQRISSEAKAIAHYLTSTNNPEIKNIKTSEKGIGLKHILKKKLYKQALADDKPANKTGKAGFILSLVGLGLLLLGLLYSPLFTIGFIISVASIICSAIGLSQIKKNPDKFRNQAETTIGLAISIGTVAVTVLFTLLFILLLVIFFSGYSNV